MVAMATELFDMFTQLVISVAGGLDSALGGGVLGNLISSMGAPAFAGLVLFGMVFGND